jgi:hypothetical protein
MGQLVPGAPGLYLNGLPSEPVLPLSAITGFVGIAERGPLHTPEPIRSWDEYLTVFGDLLDHAFLPHAVFGFFRNGGARCIVVRVADPTDARRENVAGRCPRVDPLFAASTGSHPLLDANGDETLRIDAINEGSWGNRVQFEIHPGSHQNMSLTALANAAAQGSTTVTMNEPFDLQPGATIRLSRPDDALGGQVVAVQTVNAATGVVTFTPPLDRDVPRGAVVLGQGFKLVIRFGERSEVFDNVSMAVDNPRYVVSVVNGTSASLPYIERQNRGHSILVRLTHVFDPLPPHRSRFRPVPPVVPPPPADNPTFLFGGGDGFRYSAARLKDAVGADSIGVVARAAGTIADVRGSRGNLLRVRARAFETTTALAVAAGVDRLVVQNAAGLVAGDQLTVTSGALTDTHAIVTVGADNTVVLATGAPGLANPYPLGSPVTVANRFTLDVFRDAERPFTTTTAAPAAAGVDRIVVDNIAGARAGSLTLTHPVSGATETYGIVNTLPGNVVVLATGAPGLSGSYPLGAFVRVATGAGQSLEPVEVHHNLSGDPVSPRYFRPRLAADSKWLCGDGPDVLVQPPTGQALLANGRDPGHIDFRWYTGYDLDGQYFPSGGQRRGLATLEIVDEIDLVAVPDLAGQTVLPAPTGPSGPDGLYLLPHRQVLHHAARLGDRLALLDTRAGVPQGTAIRFPQQLADPLAARFGALYYPWLHVTGTPESRAMPPSGFVAGVIARADFESGVSRAPANFPVRDVISLEFLFAAGDQDTLNPAGVNLFRRFEAPALELWGARTLSGDPSARYVNVRRLLIAIKKAIARNLLWTVFEPNGPSLRRRLLANLQSLMETLVTGGATPVATDAFFVKCDDENNPPDLANAGQLVATIGIALVAPAEFIVLNVKRTPDSLSVSEEGV